MSEARPATLLFVDDEPSILSALRRLFRPHGYRILVAEGGQAGLDILATETVDLVISDMRMPEMDGATFLKAVRQQWPGIVRILLTGYADITSTIAAINEGEIYRYIAKPWDDNEILLVVREALEWKRLASENERLTALTQQQNDELKSLNAGLEQKVAERTAEVREALGELKKTFMATVQVCAGLVELRAGQAGQQLAGHGRRVAEHARIVARRLQLEDSAVQAIMLAGLLHDIGKIGLADELLTRPFNLLTPDHRAQVMKHAALGQNILMPIEKLRDSALLIRHHHENYDGSGFPDRLAGMAIPLGSRILTVVNDYDALQIGTLAQRPLKPADALTFLIDNRGRRYDPRVVDAFAEHLAETQTSVVGELPRRPAQLKPGQQLSRELNHADGFLLLAQGSRLTPEIIQQLVKLEDTEQRHYTVYIRQEDKP
jgi:response regulator RpfG family c-di-GMP phosphodiesterase